MVRMVISGQDPTQLNLLLMLKKADRSLNSFAMKKERKKERNKERNKERERKEGRKKDLLFFPKSKGNHGMLIYGRVKRELGVSD